MHRDTGKITGSRRRRGMTVWMKRRDKYPWEKPWDEPATAPFKLRFLRHDPAGILLSQMHEGKLSMASGSYKGRAAYSVALPKLKPWYRKAPNKWFS